ncbi:unnamed protein product [Lampetra fluviatilis]
MAEPASWNLPLDPPLDSALPFPAACLALPPLVPLEPDPTGCSFCPLADVGHRLLPCHPFDAEQHPGPSVVIVLPSPLQPTSTGFSLTVRDGLFSDLKSVPFLDKCRFQD